jgi:SRSO17 transposase
MGHDLDEAARERLQQYIDTLGTHLKDRRKRESFAIYAAGVLGSAERKSVEPMASLASSDVRTSRHTHDKLLHLWVEANGAMRQFGSKQPGMSVEPWRNMSV